jgi:ketosteroid isomerase-like protein
MRAAAIGALLLGASGCSLFQVELPPAQPADDLLAADRQFARRAQLGAPEAIREFFEAQGIWLEAAGPAVIGRERIAAEAAQRRSALTWEPQFAEVAPSGEWGWTWGQWQLLDPGGKRIAAQGRYMSLWKKQPDGTWQVRSQLTAQAPR